MSEHGNTLLATALAQLDEASALLSKADTSDLSKPYVDRDPGHAGSTVGLAAVHFAEGYRKIRQLLQGAGYVPAGTPATDGHGHSHGHSHQHGPSHAHDAASDVPALLAALDDVRGPVGVLADLTDEQLDSVPPLRNQWADGQRTLGVVLETILTHQGEHLASLKDALA